VVAEEQDRYRQEFRKFDQWWLEGVTTRVTPYHARYRCAAGGEVSRCGAMDEGESIGVPLRARD
jgi:hypothetical protein